MGAQDEVLVVARVAACVRAGQSIPEALSNDWPDLGEEQQQQLHAARSAVQRGEPCGEALHQLCPELPASVFSEQPEAAPAMLIAARDARLSRWRLRVQRWSALRYPMAVVLVAAFALTIDRFVLSDLTPEPYGIGRTALPFIVTLVGIGLTVVLFDSRLGRLPVSTRRSAHALAERLLLLHRAGVTKADVALTIAAATPTVDYAGRWAQRLAQTIRSGESCDGLWIRVPHELSLGVRGWVDGNDTAALESGRDLLALRVKRQQQWRLFLSKCLILMGLGYMAASVTGLIDPLERL